MIDDIFCRGKATYKDGRTRWVYGAFLMHINRTPCVIGDSVKPEDVEYLILHDGFSDWNMPRGIDATPVDPKTVGRYTGRKDKNGCRIFEDDIVRTKHGRICKVIWLSSPRYVGFDLLPLEDRNPEPDPMDIYDRCFVEVVGNIHDTPMEALL